MAVLMIQQIPATKDQYDQVNEKLGIHDHPPDGLIVHTAEDQGEKGMHIVDVWESREAYEAFGKDRLGPAVAEVLGSAPEGGGPEHEFHDLYSVIKP
jgi:hypothetical protein